MVTAAKPDPAFGTHLRETLDSFKGWNQDTAQAQSPEMYNQLYQNLTLTGTTLATAPKGAQTFNYQTLSGGTLR